MVIVAVAAALIVAVVLSAAVHVWYALGLSRVFAAHGAEPWRAWIPLVNEAELFRLGRIDPVRAVLLVVPFVAIYGLVLKATAAHRVGERTGRGAGTTALAVLLPPVWATVLAAAEKKTPDATPPEAATIAPTAPASAEPIAVVPGLPAVASAVPSASSSVSDPATPVGAASPGRRRTSAVSAEPAVVPELPGPVEIGAPAAVPAAPAPSVPPALSTLPAAPAPAAAAPVRAPIAAPAPAAPSELAVPAPLPPTVRARTADAEVPAPPVVSIPQAAAVPLAAVSSPPLSEPAGRVSARSAIAPEVPIASEAVSEITDATGASERDERDAPSAPPVEEATQIARPRSRRRGEWELLLPDGSTAPLTGRTVVLGRKPTAADGVTQCVAVVDDTRTMSKVHARLEWTVTGWTITDLDSTNGVTLIGDDGARRRIAPGIVSPATSRFQLGDAVVEVRAVNAA